MFSGASAVPIRTVEGTGHYGSVHITEVEIRR